jgi:hypothetical protein
MTTPKNPAAVEKALRDILQICKHRWRALPKDSYEKRCIQAADKALTPAPEVPAVEDEYCLCGGRGCWRCE